MPLEAGGGFREKPGISLKFYFPTNVEFVVLLDECGWGELSVSLVG